MGSLLIIHQGGSTDTGERLGCHLQIASDIHQRGAQHQLGLILHQFLITILCTLKAEHVGMVLTQDERLLQNLTIEDLDIHTLHSHRLKIGLRHGDKNGWLQGFNLQFRGLLTEKALDTHHNRVLSSHILCKLLVVLEIELTHQSLNNPVNVGTYLSLTKNILILRKLHRHQDALKHIELLVCHRAVTTG